MELQHRIKREKLAFNDGPLDKLLSFLISIFSEVITDYVYTEGYSTKQPIYI